MSQALKLDLNNPVFQKQLFDLAKEKQLSVLKTLRKLSNMTWNQVYQDQGIKWELVYSRTGPNGKRLYSLRIGISWRQGLQEGGRLSGWEMVEVTVFAPGS